MSELQNILGDIGARYQDRIHEFFVVVKEIDELKISLKENNHLSPTETKKISKHLYKMMLNEPSLAPELNSLREQIRDASYKDGTLSVIALRSLGRR